MKCGVEDVLISVYSCFYVVIKSLVFFFRICMNIGIRTIILSYVLSNSVMRYIFVKQFFVLINPAYDLSSVHDMIDLLDLGQI